ncbi:MAG: hypothetical protein AB7R67_20300 [Vicinamibacterales bacterium]
MSTESVAFEGVTFDGRLNIPDDRLLANVAASIRRGYPQVWPVAPNPHRVALVCGGPSINATVDELRQAVFEGAKLVTVNGAYAWCLERNLQPRAQIVMDARPTNARFLAPEVPQCRYYLCSQCAPETWDAVARYPHVAIWHDESDAAVKAALDAYYLGAWCGVAGGTTVGTRAIGLLRMLGFLRFDVFGLDSCWMGYHTHAYAQPENAHDKRVRATISTVDDSAPPRTFITSPWMLKQADDFQRFVRASGDKFLLNVHGDGLIAYMLRAHAGVERQIDESA